MKKVLLLFLVFSLSCSSEPTREELIIGRVDRIVKMVFYTQEPNYDELHLSYYNYKDDNYISGIYPFEYDNQGEAQPLEVVLEDYDFRYIRGEAFRNNHSPATLRVEIYVDNELVEEDADSGDVNTFAVVRWNYDAGF